MQLHMLLAGFILPVAILYFIGGLLYTSDIKGSIDKQEFILQLDEPFKPDLDILFSLTKRALTDNQLPYPDAEPRLKKKKGVYELRWGDLSHYVKLSGRPKDRVATLVFKKRSPLAQMMRIHRADAGIAFKVLSLIMAAGLILIFASGVYMAMSIPRFRKPLIFSISLGMALFVVLLI